MHALAKVLYPITGELYQKGTATTHYILVGPDIIHLTLYEVYQILRKSIFILKRLIINDFVFNNSFMHGLE